MVGAAPEPHVPAARRSAHRPLPRLCWWAHLLTHGCSGRCRHSALFSSLSCGQQSLQGTGVNEGWPLIQVIELHGMEDPRGHESARAQDTGRWMRRKRQP